MKLSKNRVYKADNGYYERVMETSTHIYFANLKESDAIRMYDRKMKLISDDCFAVNSFKSVIEKKEYSWISAKINLS